MIRSEKEQFIIGFISLLDNRLGQILDGIVSDITFKQFFLLIVISKAEKGQKSIRQIADVYGASRQNVKKMIIALEKKGYVSVSQSQMDTRALHVELTEKTYECFKDNELNAEQASHQLFIDFSDEEMNIFINCMQKLMRGTEFFGGVRIL